ncbi:TetR/AcrR family transcriptional regulator [Nocardiopsis alba]|uniref:TetR family transcriptional regulator n=1 Tax=Nocardiopsis alba TaxID=53437 RepID=A0A7K2IQ62_9ACTN|nr:MULTISPECIES: TetR/AcrR family transcriptional regulator [Nocardiopsis]MEC3892986.1 TetR/AcrR family transcriptional regulator [Nocardiopsis sp. LDBS1602]MYR32109.1 TetR family transcriptional regulator [Nocardiopsis alba]
MSQREDLLAGAKRCLAEKGYGKTTARDIAAASGAHLASIGYHFGSKDRLMNTAVLEATSEWGDVLTRLVRESSSAAAPEERIRAVLTSLFEAVPAHRDLMVSSVQAFAQVQFDDETRAALADGIEGAREELAALLLGVAPEELDADTVAGLGSMLYNIVTGYVLQYLVSPEHMPTVDQAVAGIRALLPPTP